MIRCAAAAAAVCPAYDLVKPRTDQPPQTNHSTNLRSVTMDAWNPDQLRKMQAGGNAKLNDFFRQYGIDKATDIKVKYNNRVAEVRAGG